MISLCEGSIPLLEHIWNGWRLRKEINKTKWTRALFKYADMDRNKKPEKRRGQLAHRELSLPVVPPWWLLSRTLIGMTLQGECGERAVSSRSTILVEYRYYTSKPERGLFILQPSDYFLKVDALRSFPLILRIFFMFLCAELSTSFSISPSLASAKSFFVAVSMTD